MEALTGHEWTEAALTGHEWTEAAGLRATPKHATMDGMRALLAVHNTLYVNPSYWDRTESVVDRLKIE